MGTKTALSWDEFSVAGTSDQRWEYVDGKIQVMPPVVGVHGKLTKKIDRLLDVWEETHPDWTAFGTDCAFTMSDGAWLCPDAAVVLSSRLVGVPEDRPYPFPPDIAFEVVSPNDKVPSMVRKQGAYRGNGVLQVWVDPEKRMVEVITRDRVRYFQAGEIVGLDEMPGFEMNLFEFQLSRCG